MLNIGVAQISSGISGLQLSGKSGLNACWISDIQIIQDINLTVHSNQRSLVWGQIPLLYTI